MDHDRLFKQLLQTFFAEFVELLLPGVDAYLDRSSVEFLDKEVFTDLTGGDRHEVDFLAKTRLKGRPACFAVHVEFQSSAEADFPKRMFRYFARLYERFDLPVYPVVLFSYDEPARAEPAEHRVEFPDKMVLFFHYEVIQLNRLDWRDFADRPNPVAAALMAKMRIAPADRPAVKLACLQQIVRLALNPAKRGYATEFVNAYLELNPAEMAEYHQAVDQIKTPAEREAVMQVTNEWTKMGEARGIAIGEARGFELGQAEGRVAGLVRSAVRVTLKKFRSVSESFESRMAELPADRLEQFGEAALDFKTLADVERWIVAAAG
jgi:hypothetical protein